ncbi:LysR family transcriptional regulator substrate-binding protein [Actinocatenispora thailandica]|uniref:LysR family transcriptional regulator substrate-binding protein n=1 Tax=Actinocatenispora thailandica TaxID=227318 RepID=UPI0031DE5EFD
MAGWLDTRTVELAVLVDPPAGRGVLLASDAFCALLRRDHPLAGEPSVTVGDLDDDPFLLSRGGCERHIRRLYRSARVPFAPAHRVREMGTLLAMVRAGVGVSIVPDLAGSMLDGDLTLVPVRPRRTRRLVLAAAPDADPAAAALLAAARGRTVGPDPARSGGRAGAPIDAGRNVGAAQ